MATSGGSRERLSPLAFIARPSSAAGHRLWNTMLISFAKKCQRFPLVRLVSTRYSSGVASEGKSNTAASEKSDLPDPTLPNPYAPEKKQCILCKYKIQVDYKNVRLLSQFVSPFTGLLYDKHITGLCEAQQQNLAEEMKKAQFIGLMPYLYRKVKYCHDPRLFNPQKPQRPHKY